MLRTQYICILISIIFIFFTCQNKVFDNPYDPNARLDPDDWKPSNLLIEMLDNESGIILSWQQDITHINGFRIERKQSIDDVFSDLALSDTNIYVDTELALGKIYNYRVCAYTENFNSSYSDTLLLNYWKDCLNIWGGNAVLSGCDNVCNSTAVEDNCGTCDNDTNNDCSEDCAGEWGGSATEDNCGACVGGNTNEVACIPDCNGLWGGTAEVDECGICDGSGIAIGACDCEGNILDECGVCGGDDTACSWTNLVSNLSNINNIVLNWDPINEENVYYQIYRDGILLPIATTLETEYTDIDIGYSESHCYTVTYIINNQESHNSNAACSVTGEMSLIGGCMLVYACNYSDLATFDDGTCWTPNFGCDCYDGKGATQDNCGVCDYDSTNNCVPDCNGLWGGSAEIDACGICGGGCWDGDCEPNYECADCAGVPFGNLVFDCAGVCGGSAEVDNCDACVGGMTNEIACGQDCAGTWGGSLVDDQCGVCGGDGSSCP